MSPADQLATAYPSLFTNVRCGIELPDGWTPILLWFGEQVTKRKANVTIEQVKEKFGGLRIYTSGDDVDDLVAIAEFRASKTCERCGESGVCRGGGWLKTLCDGCHGGK